MKRVQRRRTKGWRLPPNTVYVGRPTRWGNHWAVGDPDPAWCGVSALLTPDGLILGPLDARGAVYHFRLDAKQRFMQTPEWLAPLRGRDLVCWCPLDQPCHADVLLELANA